MKFGNDIYISNKFADVFGIHRVMVKGKVVPVLFF
jgi:hypothetical protein